MKVDLDRLLAERDLDVLLHALLHTRSVTWLPGFIALIVAGDVVAVVDGLAVDRLDHVARLDPGLRRRACRRRRCDGDAALVVIAAELRADVVVDRGWRDAEEADTGAGAVGASSVLPWLLARVMAVWRTVLDGIAKPMPCAPSRVGGRLVHADHAAVVVDQRAAGVAGVDRRRGLQQAAEEAQPAGRRPGSARRG